MIFCTLFNALYLPQGIALYRSLARTIPDGFTLYVLCMDGFTHAALTSLSMPGLKLIQLSEIEDERLLAVKGSRTVGEYCWTCTTPLLLNVLARHPEGTPVTYVDADIKFFHNPTVILDELGAGSIFIHEHDFAPEHAHLLASAGRFNVGVATFRNDKEGRECLTRWKEQCIDECVMDPAAGKCGDQNYLDEWPALYRGLVVSRNPGVGLAPWNIGKWRVQRTDKGLFVNDRPIVFYHYHSLRMLRPRFGIKPTLLASGDYFFDPKVVRWIYGPYVREVWSAHRPVKKRGYGVDYAFPTLPDGYHKMDNQQILFSLAHFLLPPERNGRYMSILYGIDPIRDARPKNTAA